MNVQDCINKQSIKIFDLVYNNPGITLEEISEKLTNEDSFYLTMMISENLEDSTIKTRINRIESIKKIENGYRIIDKNYYSLNKKINLAINEYLENKKFALV